MTKIRPKAYIFDVFGTLVDWRTSVAREVTAACEANNIEIDGLAFADHWRGCYQPAMEVIRTGSRGYVKLDDLHHENLQKTLLHFGLASAFDPHELWALNSAWEKLDPWPDVVTGLNALKQDAIIAPCSNGSIALMVRLARYGGFPWDCILGSEIAQNYKPEHQVYFASCAALRLQPEEVMMVAAHNDDLLSAQQCGLQTGFIARTTEYGNAQTKDRVPQGDWNRVVGTIAELVD